MLSHKEKLRLIKFVQVYENPSGGFNFPRETPPSIAETYNGVLLFVELGLDHANPLTREYIGSLQINDDLSLDHLYRLARISQILHMTEKLSEIKDSVLGRRRKKGSKLANAYYSVLLEDILDAEGVLRRDLLDHVMKISIRRLKYMSECQKYIAVKMHAGLEVEADEAISWIRATQNCDGGFGFLPGSTSFLENVYSALDSLQMLESMPLYIQECEEFVLRCRSRDGGFGRQLMALSSLEHSLLAVRSLKILDAMRIRDESERD